MHRLEEVLKMGNRVAHLQAASGIEQTDGEVVAWVLFLTPDGPGGQKLITDTRDPELGKSVSQGVPGF